MIKRASRTLGIAALVAGALIVSATAVAKGKDPFIGHWQFDAAHSSFNAIPAYKSGTVAITAKKKDVHVTADFTMVDGHAGHYEYGGPTDGSDLAVTGSPNFTSVTLLRPDDHTVIRTDRRAGKVVSISTVTVAKDGKTMTSAVRGVTVDNTPFTASVAFSKAK